ncbi:MAG: cardiolipin synthase [Planctomycetota bacterium]|jgi:cardiolipin synthase
MGTALWIILTYVFFIASFLLGIILIAHILLQKRPPSGTIAWLLIIFFLPYIGVPLYLVFGGRKMQRHINQKSRIDLISNQQIPDDQASMIDRFLRTYNIPGAESGHHGCLCRTGHETFQAMEAVLQSAQRTIYISTFIYQPDEVGKRILDILVEKAKAGIDVHLLMDGVGSLHTRVRFFKPLIEAGGKIAFFLPVLHRPFRGRTNLRNHRKITVVDNCRVVAGGANIGTESMNVHGRPALWKDLAFVMEGPAVRHWLSVFAMDWEFAAKETLTDGELKIPDHIEPPQGLGLAEAGIVQVVPSGPDVDGDVLHDALLTMIYSAQNRFWAVTPYFVPDDALCQALTLAARRGVDVRVVLPRRSNHISPDIARGIPLRQIQAAGGQVMFYTPKMMHAKVVLMDDEAAVVGSANMDIRSLLLNYETAMFVYSPEAINEIETYIEDLMAHSKTGIAEASLPRALGESIVRLVSPLL